MEACHYCGHEEFIALLDNVLVNVTVLDDEDQATEIEWRHEYLNDGESYDIIIKCRSCNRSTFTTLEELGLEPTEEDMGDSIHSGY